MPNADRKEGRALLSTGGRNALEIGCIPIVFIPGIMGSRLHFPTINESWDPDSSWAMMHWLRIGAADMHREIHFSQPARLMRTSDNHLSADQLRRGWAELAWDFYGTVLRALDAKTFGAYHTPVYAVGYDWRQNNSASATYVAERVRQILRDERASKVIVVTHSMGGLVARAMLKKYGDVQKAVLGVIHVAQPAFGAVVMYRRLFTGATRALDGAVMSLLLGNTGRKFQTIAAAIPAAVQLLPTSQYSDIRQAVWLRCRMRTEASRASEAQGDVWGMYQCSDSPPGVLGSEGTAHHLNARYAEAMRYRLREAALFHTWLGTYIYEKTWSIYGTGHETDVCVRFFSEASEKDSSVVIDRTVRRPEGDATVPRRSGAGLFAESETVSLTALKSGAGGVSVATFPGRYRQCEIHGEEHDKICGHGDCVSALLSIIEYCAARS